MKIDIFSKPMFYAPDIICSVACVTCSDSSLWWDRLNQASTEVVQLVSDWLLLDWFILLLEILTGKMGGLIYQSCIITSIMLSWSSRIVLIGS